MEKSPALKIRETQINTNKVIVAIALFTTVLLAVIAVLNHSAPNRIFVGYLSLTLGFIISAFGNNIYARHKLNKLRG